jgi:hypothetical protein
MRSKYIPAVIMLAAGAVTSILNIINKVDRVAGLQRLLVVLIIFYILGMIAKAILLKAIEKKPEIKNQSDHQGEVEGNKPEENQ